MAKIMIVEDDRSLQSIYGDRLKADGHTIITASDGEEALAMAVKEKPDLIIADVMMPKISGFDMLDILRTTPETRSVKIIMMTALSQAEDRERANKLGADKYLVKSQVTLDDVARTVNEVVGGAGPATAIPASQSPVLTPDPAAIDDSVVVAEPIEAPAPVEPPIVEAKAIDEEQAKISSLIDDFLSKNAPDSPAPTPTDAPPKEGPTTFHPPVEAVQAPVNSVKSTDASAPKPNIFELYEKELAKESATQATTNTSEPPDEKQ